MSSYYIVIPPTQCSATTGCGKQCSRSKCGSSDCCWQHKEEHIIKTQKQDLVFKRRDTGIDPPETESIYVPPFVSPYITGNERKVAEAAKSAILKENQVALRQLSPENKESGLPFLDINTFVRLMHAEAKGTFYLKGNDTLIARGPLTIGVESVYYIKLPFDITVPARDYSYTELMNIIESDITNNLTFELLDLEIAREEERIQTGTQSTVERAQKGLAFYESLEQRYDPNNVFSILLDARMTGPSADGKYYLRLRYV